MYGKRILGLAIFLSVNMTGFADGLKNKEGSTVDASEYQPCAHFVPEVHHDAEARVSKEGTRECRG